jgi:hypothetical protein
MVKGNLSGENLSPKGEIVVYQAEDGKVKI